MPGTPAPTPAKDSLAPPAPLCWHHETEQIPPGGFKGERIATPEERAALAAALDILSVDVLRVNYRIRRAAEEGYRLTGQLSADVVQACVVTLTPVHDTVSADISVEFRPAEEARNTDGGLVNLDEETEIEPIEGNVLSVGRIVYEELAASLNPYPRRRGAAYAGEPAAPIAKESPFAVLAKLKKPT